jgi:membrane protein
MGGLLARVVRWSTRAFGTLIDRLAAVGLIQSGVVLAAYTFLALLPLLIVVVAFFPSGVAEAIADTMRRRLGLADTEGTVRRVMNSRESLRGSTSIFGVVVALVSATAFTRALQRVYELSWGLPRLGLRGSVRGVVWLIGLVAYVAVISSAVRLTGSGGIGPAVRALLLALGAVLLWWWTPYVLLLQSGARAATLRPGDRCCDGDPRPISARRPHTLAATSASSAPSVRFSRSSPGWSSLAARSWPPPSRAPMLAH